MNAGGNGAKTAELRYKPWGEVRYSSGTTATQYQYTGQYAYASLGLDSYVARFYDPALGRFTSADTVVPDGVQGYDRYTYADNNPVKYTDPSGHSASFVPVAVVIFVVVAAIAIGAFVADAWMNGAGTEEPGIKQRDIYLDYSTRTPTATPKLIGPPAPTITPWHGSLFGTQLPPIGLGSAAAPTRTGTATPSATETEREKRRQDTPGGPASRGLRTFMK